MIKRPLLFIFLAFLYSKSVFAGPIQNEVIVLLDGSGSIYDSNFATWNSILDMAELIVSQTESYNTAHGVGIVSGSASHYTAEQSAGVGRLNMHWGLHEGAIDPLTGNTIDGTQGSGDVTGFLAGLGDTDMPFGHSWHDEAFYIALQSFIGSSNPGDTNKFIFFLTDGSSPTMDHELVDAGYESPTYQNLMALGVNIVSIIFDTGETQDTAYFQDLVTDPGYLISATDLDFDAASIVPIAVPEPDSLILISLGMLGFALRSRKIRKS